MWDDLLQGKKKKADVSFDTPTFTVMKKLD